MSSAGTIDVVLMNPGAPMKQSKEAFVRSVMSKGRTRPQAEGLYKAVRKSAAKRKGKKGSRKNPTTALAKRKPAARKPAKRAAAKKPAKRRKNPTKLYMNPAPSVKDFALAGVGGAAMGGADYALEGWQALPNWALALIMGGGGLGLGILTSFLNAGLGYGIGAGGVSLGGKRGIAMLVEYLSREEGAPAGAELGQMGARAMRGRTVYGRFGAAPGHPQLGAVEAELGGRLGAVESTLGAIQADLGRIALHMS